MLIRTAAVTAPVFLASVTARPAGKENGAIRSISRYTSVCLAVPITARTTSNLRPAFAKSIGPGSIAHSRAAVWTADLTDPASRVVASQYTHTRIHIRRSLYIGFLYMGPPWTLRPGFRNWVSRARTGKQPLARIETRKVTRVPTPGRFSRIKGILHGDLDSFSPM